MAPQATLWQTTALLGMLTATAALLAGWHPLPVIVAVAVALSTVGFAAAQVILVGRVRDLVAPGDRATAAGLFNFMLYGVGPSALPWPVVSRQCRCRWR